MGFDYVTVIMFGIAVGDLTNEIRDVVVAAGLDIGGINHGPHIVGRILNRDYYHKHLTYNPKDFNDIHTQLKNIGIPGSGRLHVYCVPC
jgi:hypothetical protein